MSVTTLEGVVRNGQIVLPEKSKLPEAAKVYVIFPEYANSSPRIRSPRLVDKSRMADLKLEVIDLKKDEV